MHDQQQTGRTLDNPLCHGACNNPASPAPSLPRLVLDACRRAYTRATAQCLRPPPLLLPRRRCATALASDNPCSPACGLQAATSSRPAPRQRLRHWLCLSCCRRPVIADFRSVRAFSRTARRLRHQLRSWLRRLRRGAARRAALRGPPPLTCGEADGCDAGRVGLQGQDRAACCIAHPFGGCAANTSPRPVLFPAPFRRSHTARANPLRGIASQKPNRSVRCAQVHAAGQG